MNPFYRHFLLFCGIAFLLSFTEEGKTPWSPPEEEYIYWGDRKLNWDDFSGPIPEDSEFSALTHSVINLNFQGEGVIMEFNIEALFDPTKSWKKEGVDDYILKHEQVHFDITEYHARLLRKKLKTTKYKSFDTIEAEVKGMFNQAYDDANKMQVQYDDQTHHSIDRKKQSKWNKKMKKLLKSTNTYKNTKLKVNVSYLTE